mgnify:CR=1 FL=1
MKATLLVYAKQPRVGFGKSRLAADAGKVTAWRIARTLMQHTLKQTSDPRWTTRLYCSPDRAAHDPDPLLRQPGTQRLAQGKGDLSDRLELGLRQAPHGPVLFVGTDAPALSRTLIWQAITTLHHHDAVMGPATDGGFWLFGLRRPPRHARWSGPHAMGDVLANLPTEFRVATLPTLRDIDTLEDWKIWRLNSR